MKKFLNDESGDTNLVSIIIVLALVIIAVILFKPYILKFALWIRAIFFS